MGFLAALLFHAALAQAAAVRVAPPVPAAPLVPPALGPGIALSQSLSSPLPRLEERVVRAWTETLASIPAARAETAFLESHRVTFKIAPLGDEFGEAGNIALFEADPSGSGGTLLVNETMLDKALRGLQRQGASVEDAPVLFARLTAGIVAHELRHGITKTGIREKTGFPFPVNFLDNEVFSYRVQAMVSIQTRELFPSLRSYSIYSVGQIEQTVLDAWAKGPQGLEEYVQDRYSGILSLRDSGEDALLARLQEAGEQIEERLLQVDAAKKRLESADSDEMRDYARTELSLATRDLGEQELRDALAKIEAARKAIGTPGFLGTLRALLEGERAGLDRQEDAPEWRQWRESRLREIQERPVPTFD
jgi:hypothetical protein